MIPPTRWSLERLIADLTPGDGEPLRRTFLLHTSHLTINVVHIAHASAATPHIHHEHDEIIQVLLGQGRFRLGGETLSIKAGDLIAIPQGTVHGPLSAPLVLLSIYGPPFDPERPDREVIITHDDDPPPGNRQSLLSRRCRSDPGHAG